MNLVKRELIDQFRQRRIDWMGYKINSINDLSYHHIIKRCDGGLMSYDNGALLRKDTAHEYLHIIEGRDNDMYCYINKILKVINTQGYKPTKEELLAIREVLLLFEREHCSDRNAEGKMLIKRKYIEGRERNL